MTPEEKRKQMEDRDARICAGYRDGQKISQLASTFRMNRQRIIQILKREGAWRPYQKNGRDTFLGVSISREDKVALEAEAERRGVSMSSLSAEAIHEMLNGLREQGA